MPKFNTIDKRRAPSGLVTSTTPGIVTGNGAPAFTRDVKSELFLFAVNNMVSEDTFYEKAGDRDKRYRDLVAAVAVADPDWMLQFVGWLRNTANMRSASGVAAAEAVSALLKDAKMGARDPRGWNRKLINVACQRADEPGELLAYWMSRFGRKLPKPVKRGLADATRRLYNQRSLLKYDTDSKQIRFGDVLELTHAAPGTPEQSALFKYAIDRRHGRPSDFVETLTTVNAEKEMRASLTEADWLDPAKLRAAGLTWEDAFGGGGPKGIPKSKLWDALIPTMGYMALLRNLRNFEEAGISRASVEYVQKRLADPAQVEKSRQFPYRFLSAQQEVQSQAWGDALDQALTHSLRNLPSLPGKSLILIDTSGSMQSAMSEKSKMTAQKVAAVFGVALGITNDADVYGFADRVFQHKTIKGASVLREVERFNKRNGEAGHGTQLLGAIQATYAGHSRVFILSDLQISPYLNDYARYSYGNTKTLDQMVPANIPVYCFNLCGYKATPVPAGGRRYEFGGLTDATFRLIPLLEAGRNGTWPWEIAA